MHPKALLKGMKSTVIIMYETKKKFKGGIYTLKNGDHTPNQL